MSTTTEPVKQKNDGEAETKRKAEGDAPLQKDDGSELQLPSWIQTLFWIYPTTGINDEMSCVNKPYTDPYEGPVWTATPLALLYTPSSSSYGNPPSGRAQNYHLRSPDNALDPTQLSAKPDASSYLPYRSGGHTASPTRDTNSSQPAATVQYAETSSKPIA
ncbi:hypothetical protein Tdes44962_MAKER08139 [Teratosphaeria destructans]|uniref:Uncharacterized protein n=1 Tax=Teratosphaeria destructans TaxID=418781 RepID=A0A9W7W501_9PEZI|nr:hypothetical protein Tdes44962_MAKER08139 [Teratosphaeria destructans]